MMFQRIFVIDLVTLGLGEAPDANRYQSIGAESLQHLVAGVSETNILPTLSHLGLGNLFIDAPLAGIPVAETPTGFFGKLHINSPGNTRATKQQEMWQGDAKYLTVFDCLSNQRRL